MRRPFEKLMVMCTQVECDPAITLGELSTMWDEPVPRIMDAIDANKVLRGEPTYIALGRGDESA